MVNASNMYIVRDIVTEDNGHVVEKGEEIRVLFFDITPRNKTKWLIIDIMGTLGFSWSLYLPT